MALPLPVANENLSHVDIKSRLNTGNASYLSVQNLLSPRLLSKSMKLQIVLYECENWPLTSRGHTLRVSENRMLRKIFEPKRDETIEDWRKLHNEELRSLYSRNIIVMTKPRRINWQGM
jgi:hypothetical protein